MKITDVKVETIRIPMKKPFRIAFAAVSYTHLDADYDIDSVLNDAALADCTAVREGHVYQLPHAIEAVDSPVPVSYTHLDVYKRQAQTSGNTARPEQSAAPGCRRIPRACRTYCCRCAARVPE